MPSTFKTSEVTAGVWAAVAPSTAGPAISNAAIIDLGDKTIVVDTFMTMLAAREMAEEALRLTGRSPFLVINSHWHSDHVRGNATFADVPIAGTERMIELIVEDAPKTVGEFTESVAALQKMAEKLMAEATTDEQRERAVGTTALAQALAAEEGSYQLTLPNVLVEDRLDIEGERRATVLNFGRGHTESDLLVHLPDDGVVIAGDLVWTEIHPKTSDGFPSDWALGLARIEALAPIHVVSGHGPPGSATEVRVMADYMRQVKEMVIASQEGDLDPAAAQPPAGSEDWQDVARFRAGLAKLAAK